MDGISLSWRLLPIMLVERHGLQDKAVSRGNGADIEYRFLACERRPVLPVWYGGELQIVPWATHQRTSPLPRRRTITLESLEAGELQNLQPESVEIPATFGLDHGIWYRITQAVQGVLVRASDGSPVVYVVTREATHYYQVMTRNNREPILIGETI